MGKVCFKTKDIETNKEYYDFNTKKESIRIKEALGLIGNFDERTNLYIKDKMYDSKGKKVVFECIDDDDNVIIFYGKTPNKENRFKIDKRKYNYSQHYDLSLAKDYPLSKDTIELTRSDYIINTRHGRLITDRYSFYNLFVNKNTVYHIHGDFKKDILLPLSKDISKIPPIINLNIYANIFNKVLKENNSDFTNITLSAYIDFNKQSEVLIKK